MPMPKASPKAVVFDLGGVLIDWNPRYLYRKLLATEEEVDWFLGHVCTSDWNGRQDEGRTWAAAVAERSAHFPDYADLVSAYDTRWHEMLGGAFEETVSLLETLDDQGVPCFALTNWSAEKYSYAAEFPFMRRFRGVVVSGHEGVRKPDPRIFQILTRRFDLDPGRTVFIDDVAENVEAGERAGFLSVRYTDTEALKNYLTSVGLLSLNGSASPTAAL